MLYFVFNALTRSAQPAAHGTSAYDSFTVLIYKLQLGPFQICQIMVNAPGPEICYHSIGLIFCFQSICEQWAIIW